ncbi:MAG: flagellar protein FlgN [Clostridia bacterium]|nr:flagellar protein FlgN [Clostridia bacterium]
MTKTPEMYMDRLTEISNKKYDLLKEMLLLTKEQALVITEDSLEKLQAFIVQKQEIIERINKLDEEFDVYFQRLKQELKVKNLDEMQAHNIKGTAELKSIVSDIMRLIGEISEIENQNNCKAKELLDSLGNEIKKINHAKVANSAYKGGTGFPTPSYFIDRKK